MLSRRLRTISIFVIGFAAFVLFLPLILPVALVRDGIMKTGWSATRFVGVVLFYGLMDSVVLVVVLGLWCARPVVSAARYAAWHRAAQTWWACWLLRFLLFSYRMRLEVEGADVAKRGPYIMLMRHVSMGDTLLPIHCVQAPFSMRLRYVLKTELMMEPCLDIVGHRLPNAFVSRDSEQPESERSKVAELARDLGRFDGVVLFPEGTRFSPQRRERVIASLDAQGRTERAEVARRLEHVLPVRPGGVMSMLRMQQGVDIVFVAHVGFEGATRLPDLLSGALLGRVVKVALWRESTAHLGDEGEVRAWLDTQWERVDQWVAENRP